MSRLQDCHGCQIGDHSRHRRVVQAVPKGMMGGVVCPCKGECKNYTLEQKYKNLGISGLFNLKRK